MGNYETWIKSYKPSDYFWTKRVLKYVSFEFACLMLPLSLSKVNKTKPWN